MNKKIVNPITERLTPFDFIYTFKGQGSTKFRDWLASHCLHQEYCGLVNVPNMHDIYGVYYDFGGHISANTEWKTNIPFLMYACDYFGYGNIQEESSMPMLMVTNCAFRQSKTKTTVPFALFPTTRADIPPIVANMLNIKRG